MDTRKLILTGIISFGLFLAGYIIYLLIYVRQPESRVLPQVSPGPTFISEPSFSISPTRTPSNLPEKINASGVTVDNFYRDGQQIMTNNDVIIRDNSDFQFVYFAKGDYFLLSINNSPFEEVRKRSEQELLKILNITQVQACNLKIRVITPHYVNKESAYKDYPLSFCT